MVFPPYSDFLFTFFLYRFFYRFLLCMNAYQLYPNGTYSFFIQLLFFFISYSFYSSFIHFIYLILYSLLSFVLFPFFFCTTCTVTVEVFLYSEIFLILTDFIQILSFVLRYFFSCTRLRFFLLCFTLLYIK